MSQLNETDEVIHCRIKLATQNRMTKRTNMLGWPRLDRRRLSKFISSARRCFMILRPDHLTDESSSGVPIETLSRIRHESKSRRLISFSLVLRLCCAVVKRHQISTLWSVKSQVPTVSPLNTSWRAAIGSDGFPASCVA